MGNPLSRLSASSITKTETEGWIRGKKQREIPEEIDNRAVTK